MKKFAAYLFVASLVPFGARAADGTLAVTPGTGATIVVSPSGSDIVPHSIPCDRTTVTQCIAIDSTGHIATQAPVNATGIAGSNASAPLAAQIMVSDGTNLQRVLAPLILGDGVNGNNMLADGLWGFNGTTWDRLQVDGSKQLKVVLPTGASTSALQTTANGYLATIAAGQTPGQQLASASSSVVPCSDCGWTPIVYASLTGLSTTDVKATAGSLGVAHCSNPNASTTFVQVFNVVHGSVTLGSTAPSWVVMLAPSTTDGMALAYGSGIVLGGSGISVAATTTATGASAPGSAVICSFGYH
jgi:hypothetical protein